MATVLLPIIPGTLPPGICFSSEQQRLVTFAEYLNAQLAGGLAFYNYGSDTPSVENQQYPWIRTQDKRIYEFVGVWRTPVNYDLNERRLYAGSTTDLLTYDGGAAGPVTSTTGPMWEVDTTFAGRIPMAPGDIPGSDPTKTLALGEDYGAGSITPTVAQLPEHSHKIKFATNDTGSGFPSGATGNAEAFEEDTEVTGEGEPMNIVPPVRGIYLIKWTGRLYRTL